MARKLRVQYEGAIYQVMNRGDHREDIFRDGKDRQLFLHILGQASAKTDWQIHAWCLMRNRFHLVVEAPKANLVDGMKSFLGTFQKGPNYPQFCYKVSFARAQRGGSSLDHPHPSIDNPYLWKQHRVEAGPLPVE